MKKEYIFFVNIVLDDNNLIIGCFSNIDLALKRGEEIYKKYFCRNTVNIYKCPVDEDITDYKFNIIKPCFIIKIFHVIYTQ